MSYSAVILNEKSCAKLKSTYGWLAPSWKWYGHHMTIKMGGLPEDMNSLVGQPYSLIVTHLGRSETAIALRVQDGGLSFNKIPHVTLLVNVNAGGKPVDSNNITNWEKIDNQFKIEGIIEELK
jgi:hypothetical protein